MNRFSYNILFDVVTDDKFWSEHSADQQAHVILSILLGTTIFSDLSNHCYLHYLVNLADLDRVKDLNSGLLHIPHLLMVCELG